jgi:hypothetical protein
MFTFDVSTDIGKVRMLCDDTADTGHIFEDEEISATLSLESDPRLAAAYCLELKAAQYVRVQGQIKLLDFETNGPSLAKAMQALAKSLRDRADETAGFDWAEMVTNSFTERQRIYKQFLRGAI